MRKYHTTNNLKQYRKEAGYTQQEATDLIGLASSSHLSEWENGTSLPSITNLFRLNALYQISAQKLYVDLYKETKNDVRKRVQNFNTEYRQPRIIKKKEVGPFYDQSSYTEDELIDQLAGIMVEGFLALNKLN